MDRLFKWGSGQMLCMSTKIPSSETILKHFMWIKFYVVRIWHLKQENNFGQLDIEFKNHQNSKLRLTHYPHISKARCQKKHCIVYVPFEIQKKM